MDGHRPNGGCVSGDDGARPVVRLIGSPLTGLVHAIPELERLTGGPITVVGGLAVLCRLSVAHRVTTDLDTVTRRSAGEQPQLEVLLESGAAASGATGVLLPTPSGPVQVDVLEVAEADLLDLPHDPNDRLYVLAHEWGIATADAMTIEVGDGSGAVTAEALVAGPGPLIAMKLHSLMNRPTAKERTDLLDIVQLVLDPVAGPVARAQLRTASRQLAEDVGLHVRRHLVVDRRRTVQLLAASRHTADIDADAVALAADLLLAELSAAARPSR